jgi:hypothetical protein
VGLLDRKERTLREKPLEGDEARVNSMGRIMRTKASSVVAHTLLLVVFALDDGMVKEEEEAVVLGLRRRRLL